MVSSTARSLDRKSQARFREGHGSHVIDLPGNRKSIDGVEFVYRSIDRRRGEGKVLLYARAAAKGLLKFAP
jgi:hypothetical protein